MGESTYLAVTPRRTIDLVVAESAKEARVKLAQRMTPRDLEEWAKAGSKIKRTGCQKTY